jgi:hypothetical protein
MTAEPVRLNDGKYYDLGDGIEVTATPEGIEVKTVFETYVEDGVSIPWPDVLRHAPTPEIINELFRRAPPPG